MDQRRVNFWRSKQGNCNSARDAALYFQLDRLPHNSCGGASIRVYGEPPKRTEACDPIYDAVPLPGLGPLRVTLWGYILSPFVGDYTSTPSVIPALPLLLHAITATESGRRHLFRLSLSSPHSRRHDLRHASRFRSSFFLPLRCVACLRFADASVCFRPRRITHLLLFRLTALRFDHSRALTTMSPKAVISPATILEGICECNLPRRG